MFHRPPCRANSNCREDSLLPARALTSKSLRQLIALLWGPLRQLASRAASRAAPRNSAASMAAAAEARGVESPSRNPAPVQHRVWLQPARFPASAVEVLAQDSRGSERRRRPRPQRSLPGLLLLA